MSNCHSKYLKINMIDSDCALIDEFSKKCTNLMYRLRYSQVCPLKRVCYGRKISNLQKIMRNYYISTRSYDRDSVKRRVRRRINIIRLKKNDKH